MLSAIDTAVYIYEFLTAKTDEERVEAAVGIGVGAIGKILDEGLDMLKIITDVVDLYKFEQIKKVLGYVYSALSSASGGIVDEIEYWKGKVEND